MIRATILTKQCSIRSQYSTSVSLSSRNMSELFLLRSSMTENSKHKNASFTFVWALLNKCRILEQQEIQEVDIFCFSHMETSSELLRVVECSEKISHVLTRVQTLHAFKQAQPPRDMSPSNVTRSLYCFVLFWLFKQVSRTHFITLSG